MCKGKAEEERKMSLKKKSKDGKPSLWEIIKALWKIERDMRKIEKRSRRKRK